MSRTTLSRTAAALAVAVALVAVSGASASGTFVQPVRVLHTFHGPTTGKGAYFGWAVSGVGDIDGDHVTDLVVGEVNGGSHMRGRVWVYSGRTGRLLFRRAGRANDQNGYAVADAGDVNGDGVPDVVSGAPGVGSAVGHVTCTREPPARPSCGSPGITQATSSARRSRAPATSTATATPTS
jgi:hypothetical protein